MFKRNNKEIVQQSSQSQIQSDNQLNEKQQRKIMYENEHDDSQNQEQNQQQENEEDAQQMQYSNKKMNKNNRQVSSDSDDQQEDSIELIKDKINKQYNRNKQEQSDDDDSQEEDSFDGAGQTYFRTIQAKNGIHTIREDPKQSLQDDSIDHIQLRIKKLEKDLENRLNKHKGPNVQKQMKKNQDKVTNHGKIVGASKISSHPPIPIAQKKVSQPQPQPQHQDIENRINAMNQPKEAEKVKQKKNQIKKTFESQTNIYAPPLTKEKKVSKKQQNPQIRVQRKSDKSSKVIQSGVQKKLKTKPKQQVQKVSKEKEQNKFFNDKPCFSDHHNQNSQLNSKVSEMEKVIKQLKLQNQVLKQKLESSSKQAEKQRERQKQKIKNKTIQELTKLKDGSTVTKLQKQIELLQVIQKLQSKLKKSISRKLAKQGNAGVSLLHKGLPTSIQSHM